MWPHKGFPSHCMEVNKSTPGRQGCSAIVEYQMVCEGGTRDDSWPDRWVQESRSQGLCWAVSCVDHKLWKTKCRGKHRQCLYFFVYRIVFHMHTALSRFLISVCIDLRLPLVWFLLFFFFPCRFGRKPVMFGSIALQSLSTIAQVFSTSWPMFCVFYFLTGLGRVSSYLSSFVLGKSEYVLLL